MKKKLLTTISLMIVIFAVITVFKSKPGPDQAAQNSPEKSLAEKEIIQNFWQEYRSATKYRIAGNIEKAAEKYRAALKLQNDHEDALYYLGNMYLELKQFREAQNVWQRLTEINPASSRAYIQLGNLYLRYEQADLFDIELAGVAFRQALDINSEETGPLIGLGQIALIKNRLNEAREYFTHVLGSNFKSVEAYFLNGYIAWKIREHREALAMFKKAVEYARPAPPPSEDVLREGDSKPESMPGEIKYSSLFKNLANELREVDEQQFSEEMELRYRKLDGFVKQIREKI